MEAFQGPQSGNRGSTSKAREAHLAGEARTTGNNRRIGYVQEAMKIRVFVVIAAALMVAVACDNNPTGSTSRSDDSSSTSPAEEIARDRAIVPDVIGLDARRAVQQLQSAGLDVEFGEGISRAERSYALAKQTHPTVIVAETQPGSGQSVALGEDVVIADARCPHGRRAC